VIAQSLPARTAEEVARLVRALGSHRYVAGRLILVHAFVFEALGSIEELHEAHAWSRDLLASADIDASSRDPRLHRATTERELACALARLWSDDDAAAQAREALHARLRAIDAPFGPTLFDESREDEVFPILVDAGWELFTLAELDPTRHRGAIEAFGDELAFDVARHEEETAVDALPPLHELPALGPAELVHGAAHGILRAPLVLWTSGHETYTDYVLRGVLRAAKLD
jgi:hypothetical protein